MSHIIVEKSGCACLSCSCGFKWKCETCQEKEEKKNDEKTM